MTLLSLYTHAIHVVYLFYLYAALPTTSNTFLMSLHNYYDSTIKTVYELHMSTITLKNAIIYLFFFLNHIYERKNIIIE